MNAKLKLNLPLLTHDLISKINRVKLQEKLC